MSSRSPHSDWAGHGHEHVHEHEGPCAEGDGRGGLGGFLRSLLAGIPWSERVEVLETRTLPAPRSGALRLDNANGMTRILGEDRSDVEVKMQKVARAESTAAAEAMAQEIRLVRHDTDSGTELEVEAPRRWNRRGHANLELRVPRGTRVEVSASNGKVCVAGLGNGLRVRSSNVAVRVEDVSGDVEIHASNARLLCAGVCGRLLARTSNGKIEVERHRGALDASSSNGLIHAAIEELGGPVVLATSNGKIALELPDEVDADVNLRVDNGVIRNQRSLCRCTRSSGGRLTGQLGKGGTPIKLRTSNGSISLR
ncbi:MAG: DUF4097 family beta strand repeat-containing protein [Deltaproteobacteria bacterium]|nr:DUF4097 family beta strand repeat-containing protein [Deltaproteobacteria bacterium]